MQQATQGLKAPLFDDMARWHKFDTIREINKIQKGGTIWLTAEKTEAKLTALAFREANHMKSTT
jgi:hypothetical protein